MYSIVRTPENLYTKNRKKMLVQYSHDPDKQENPDKKCVLETNEGPLEFKNLEVTQAE